MSPLRVLTLLVTALVVGSAIGVSGVAAQEDLVTMTVTVTTPDGEPVRDARLRASWDGGSSGPRNTASNGKAFIDVPDGADVTIRTTHADYVRNVDFSVSNAGDREVTMTVYPKASATVVVEDGSGTVADASVTLRKAGVDVVQASTDEAGTVETGTIESGTYTVSALKSGYFRQQEAVSIDGDAEITVTMDRGTVTLEVNVTDDHFEPPRAVEGATVDVDGSGSVTTQPTGIGRISVPVNAWATVAVTKDGYESASESIYVQETDATLGLTIERTPDLNLELLSQRVVIGERASLSVTDEYGEPVPGATVRVDGEAVTETDDDGRAVVRVDAAGNHTVVAEQGSLSSEERTVVGVGSDDPETDAEPEPTDSTPTETESELPGFGVGVAVLAIVAAVLVGLTRRRTGP